MEVAKQSQSSAADKGTNGKHLHVEYSVNPHDYMNSMTITAAIRIHDTSWPRGQLVAYVEGSNTPQGVYPSSGQELLIAPSVFPAPWGGNPSYHLMVHGHVSDEGKPLALKLFSSENDQNLLVSLKCLNGSLTFGADKIVGNAMVPAVLIPDWEAAKSAAAPAAPAPTACEDAEPNAFNDWIDVKFPGMGRWGPFECKQFVAWDQCNVVAGQCDKSCGVCSGLLLTEKKLDVAKISKSLGGEALKQTLTKASGGLEALTFDVEVIAAEYEHSMTVTIVVKIGNEFPRNGKLIATVGGQVQGVVTANKRLNPLPGTYQGKPVYHLMVRGGHVNGNGNDEGKPVEFFYITPDNTITDLKQDDDKLLNFVPDDHHGNAIHPVVLLATAPGMLVEA